MSMHCCRHAPSVMPQDRGAGDSDTSFHAASHHRCAAAWGSAAKRGAVRPRCASARRICPKSTSTASCSLKQPKDTAVGMTTSP